MGISFNQQLVSLHITRKLLYTQLLHQAHQEQMTIRFSPTSTQTYHQSIHHTCQKGDERNCWMRQSHPMNDRQCQELSSCTGLSMFFQCNTGSRTGIFPHIWRDHYPGQCSQHATSSEGAGTTKQSHTPYQWQQINHMLHAPTGTHSEGAHWYS